MFAILNAEATIVGLEAGVKRYAQEVAGKEPQWVASPVRWLAAEPVRYQVPAKTYLERPLR